MGACSARAPWHGDADSNFLRASSCLQVPDVEAVVIPVGGAGLIAGTALALKTLKPDVIVIGEVAAAQGRLPLCYYPWLHSSLHLRVQHMCSHVQALSLLPCLP
jgi:hypothetical protein